MNELGKRRARARHTRYDELGRCDPRIYEDGGKEQVA
jgi:hypothetical protein